MTPLEKLQWELALLLNGRADAVFTHEWDLVHTYDGRIERKEAEIRLAEAAVDQLAAQLFPGVRVAP